MCIDPSLSDKFEQCERKIIFKIQMYQCTLLLNGLFAHYFKKCRCSTFKNNQFMSKCKPFLVQKKITSQWNKNKQKILNTRFS
jgi:hypothetical protein